MTCPKCGSEFQTFPSRQKKGRSRHCGAKCYHESQRKPNGLTNAERWELVLTVQQLIAKQVVYRVANRIGGSHFADAFQVGNIEAFRVAGVWRADGGSKFSTYLMLPLNGVLDKYVDDVMKHVHRTGKHEPIEVADGQIVWKAVDPQDTTDTESTDEAETYQHNRETIRKALGKLSPLEASVVTRMFGLDGRRPGQMTNERTEQVGTAALAKLRTALEGQVIQ